MFDNQYGYGWDAANLPLAKTIECTMYNELVNNEYYRCLIEVVKFKKATKPCNTLGHIIRMNNFLKRF